jgi:nucleoid-associated protein YgaU
VNNVKLVALRIGAALMLVVLVVAPPVGVAALIGRPYPDLSTLRDQIDIGQVSTDTIMRIAAALFIGIWVWIVATIAGEVFRIIGTQHPTAGLPTRTGPERTGSSGILHRLVRLALLGTVTTAATVSTWSSVAVATAPTLSALTRGDTAISASADPTESTSAAPSTATVVADGRSTPLSVAVDLGDENLRDDIVAMNRSPQWSNGVFPAGMLITVPLIETQTPRSDNLAPGWYVVQDNDGMWNVAHALLGDGARHDELRALLIGQEVAPGVIFTADTSVIHPGWIFRTPAKVPTEAPTGILDTVVVQRGDTLSRLAEAHLGDPDRWHEIWDLNANATMPDGRTFDDPNLLLEGWQLAITAERPAATPATVELDEPPVDEPVADGSHQASPTEVPVAETTPTATTVPDSSAVPAVPSASPIPPLTQSAAPGIPSEKTLPPPHAPAEPSRIDQTSGATEATSIWSTVERSVWPNLSVGALLLAGLAETIRRLRNRRLSRLAPGHRLAEPSSVVAGTELAISQANTTPIRSTIHGLLRSLTPYAAEQSDPPAVRAVQVGAERIEVLFSKPAPLPPTGWSTIDGGHSWTHQLEEPTGQSRQLLTPALVTIGVRTDEAGDEVLLDLETAGSLSIVGDRDAALGLARSIALELATYPLGVSMDVCLIGLHVDGTEVCDRVWLDTTMTRAVRVAQQRLDRFATDGATNIVTARAELDEDDGAHDPQVFIVDLEGIGADDRTLVDDLVRLCQPSTGTALVLIGGRDDIGECITIDNDGSAQWSGVDLRAPNVTREAAGEIAVMLDHVANAESAPIEPDEWMVEATTRIEPVEEPVQGKPAGAGEPRSDAPEDEDLVEFFEYRPPAHDVVVQVMGNVRTHGADLTADETELLALLTCLRNRTEIHIGLVHESIAPERAKKTVENRVSRLRGRLGVGSDGRDLLPEASSGRNGRSHYLVSPLVLTDVDLLEHRYHTADTLGSTDALTVLRDGLELMEGPLFRARKGFDGWPQSEGVVVSMTALVQSYATRLIGLAVDVDDIALVIRTTATVGRVLDNPLSEFPMRQAEQAYAEACGDTDLLASVEGARQRLIEFIDTDDALADV